MVLICGEVEHNQIRICFLEDRTKIWSGHGLTFRVQAYRPKFLTITAPNDGSKYFHLKFKSDHGSSGLYRRARVRKNPKSAWVVSCNNTHTIRPCSIWPRIHEKPADMVFHLGDQIYADRIYWRWWRYLSTVDPDKWFLYKADIQREYYREYFETWTPLQCIFNSSSHVMIPDDHEIRDRAKVFDYLVAGASGEKASWSQLYNYLSGKKDHRDGKIRKDHKNKKMGTDHRNSREERDREERNSRKEERNREDDESKGRSSLETFLFVVAMEVCEELYLGLRLTNLKRFDYFRVINGVSIIMNERITKPFLDEDYWDSFNFFKRHLTSKVLWMGGLPPCPVRPNFCELLLYRHEDGVDDQEYEELYRSFFDLLDTSSLSSKTCKEDRQVILIGGDLHAGVQGRIYEKKRSGEKKRMDRYLKFHVSSPSSGFPSSYIPKDCIDSTANYEVRVDKYRPSDANAVWVDFSPFESYHEFSRGSWVDCWQNALSTGYTFFT